MRKFAFAAMLTLAAGVMLAPVSKAQDDGEKKFTIHGEVRARWEYVENTQDLTDSEVHGDGLDDAFDFWPYRVRIGVMGQFSDMVSGYVEIQNFGNFGNKSPQFGYADPVFQNAGNDLESDLQLYQGYIELDDIGGSSFDLVIGRQEYSLGKELMLGDLDYYNGQSFDGASGSFQWDMVGLNLFYFNTDERNAPGLFGGLFGGPCGQAGGSFCEDQTRTLFGATVPITLMDDWVVEPYVIYYRDPIEADASSYPGLPFFSFIDGAEIWTIGARFDKDADGETLLDWHFELAGQSGDIGPNDAMLDVSSSVVEGWIGFNLGSERNHRVAIGAFSSSGDKDENDNDAEGFIPLFPDNHSYNRLGNMDFGGQLLLGGLGISGLGTGITDLNVSYTGTFGNHTFFAGYHQMVTTEKGPDTFVGLDEDDFGSEIDLVYDYAYSSNLSFQVLYSLFQPGDLFELAGAPNDLQDDAMRAAGQVRLRW